MSITKIDNALNLVMELPDGKRIYHTPISEAVFEANFKVLAETKAKLFGKGMAYAASSGIKISRLTLLDEGRKLAAENDGDGDYGATALLAEISRLTNVLLAGDNGWDLLPVANAISQGTVDADDWKDVENIIVFFTCAYALASRREKRIVSEAIAELGNFSLTSSTCEEYMNSLKTPVPSDTRADATKSKRSSIPL